MKPFQFKEFSVAQDKTAMKIGTDAVLLGAWARIADSVSSILDIGAGTGVIALQMAQRSDAELIDAVEIEPNAYEQCVSNFEQSDWGDRLFCYHAALEEVVEEIEEPYDLIVSNPPFYTSTYKELEAERAMARHTDSLSFEELLKGCSEMLSDNGECAFIIPFEHESCFLDIAKKYDLFPNRITRVKGTEESLIKRSMLQLSFTKAVVEMSNLTIEIERHVYTTDYIELVAPFYLKM
ncbi:MAG: tRNA (adenine-N(6)-)-methyltransferase [Flavobacteriaceae bacterium]|nr:MAG: tRNA (adenine-N(6)-)-methyltransferase [Flavobacteriaceae bacterium]